MKISGFTIVRNATTLGYPFRESVLSALPLCDEFIIGLGDSEDDTDRIVMELSETYQKVRVIRSRWEMSGQGGEQLSAKTNECLSACSRPWALYVQADEVLHEQDYSKIRDSLLFANAREEVDGITFDYRHFYGDYNHEIRGRSWYRREVRIIRTDRGILSFRDAQGFRLDGEALRAIHSYARVFHYGYVRSPESLRTKSEQMAIWWGHSPGSDYRLKRHVGLRRYQDSHPVLMVKRIALHPNDFDPRSHPFSWSRKEFKDLLTIAWESIVPFRLGEFKNYQLLD